MNNNIYNYIVKHTTSGHIDKETAIEMIAMLKQSGAKVHDEIAIIGMSAKLPGANNIQEYWDNIMNGIDCITNIPDDRRGDNDRYADFMGMDKADIIYPEFGYLDQIDGFDYDFFRMPP